MVLIYLVLLTREVLPGKALMNTNLDENQKPVLGSDLKTLRDIPEWVILTVGRIASKAILKSSCS